MENNKKKILSVSKKKFFHIRKKKNYRIIIEGNKIEINKN